VHRLRLASLLVLAAFSSAPVATAQEPVDLDVVARIRAEGFKNSQVMDTIWHLTDRYGPRLTNSPMQRKASAWAAARLEEFGLKNAHLEPWGEFGLGWSYERCVVSMESPTYVPMIAIPKAWTRGTAGEVRGEPVWIRVDSEEDLEQYRGQLTGRIVLQGDVSDVESPFEPLARRHDEESLGELMSAPELEESSTDTSRFRDWRRQRELSQKVRELLISEGAACLIVPDGGRRNDYGVLTLGSGGSYDPEEERALAQVVVSTEQFNRIARLIERDEHVEMSVDVRTSFHDQDLEGRNVVAEIPGSDPMLRGQVVMLGGHFDSWHPATGATDNGASCAVMMEAARILAALDLRPRRTIRVALWTGEEQGLLGSRGYVDKHFGDRDTMELLPEHGNLAAYFNLDNGAGKIRGVYLQENLAVKPIFEAWLAPFADLEATTLTLRNTGGTDHLSFDRVGLPGFQFVQDPMDYGTRTHHTNMDTYERVHPADVKQASVIVASFAYHAAMRDEMLPRKPLPVPREEPARRPEPTPRPEVQASTGEGGPAGEAKAVPAAAGSAQGAGGAE